MPFTGSHPAAILPFTGTRLPASALVVGSIAPDVPYYLPVDVVWRTHTVLAVVTTDVLIGVLVWGLWHGLLSGPALATAPAGVRARLAGRVQVGLRTRLTALDRIAWTLLALVVGAGTHVLWDEFTHEGRWGVEHLPALADTWWLLPGHRWLQYLSSVAGILALLIWSRRWWQRTPPRPEPPAAGVWAWGALVGVGTAAGAAGALSAPTVGSAAFAGATWGGGAALMTAILLALAWHACGRLRT